MLTGVTDAPKTVLPARWTAICLSIALLVPATARSAPQDPASAPAAVSDARPDEQERIELERETRLDLSKPWQGYVGRRSEGSFYQYVEKDFRRKRNIGWITTVVGVSGLIVGGSLFSIAVVPPKQLNGLEVASEVLMGVSGVATVVGAVIWGVYYRKMERLEVSEDRGIAIGPRGRVRLQSLSPTGLRLAF